MVVQIKAQPHAAYKRYASVGATQYHAIRRRLLPAFGRLAPYLERA